MILKNLKKRIITSLVLLFLVFLIIKFDSILILSLIIFGVLSIIEFFNITQKIFKNSLLKLVSNIFFSIFIFIFCFMFFFFSNFLQLKIIVYILLLGCIASDIGGFVFGKTFKGPKLTKISPNKTIAGVFGSIIFTIISITILAFYFTKTFDYKFLIIAFITSVSCQIGDLIFSFLKRKAKIKDTGNFLPGHGGILDRLDGIFLGIPVSFYFLTLIF
jgi:phosphatidate cytidylyltransferase